MKSVFANRKKRSREEIIASILTSAKQGASKTGIMYANYLSFHQLNKYLSFGLQARLMYLREDGRYFTTTKGLGYLRCFEEIHNTENYALEKRRHLQQILDGDMQSIC
jgi:predicted transcriptional regulator